MLMNDLDEYIMKNKDSINVNELMEKFGLSIATVYRHLSILKVKPNKTHNNQRREEFKALRDEGKTYQEIGDMYGISRQRVEQIINGHN